MDKDKLSRTETTVLIGIAVVASLWVGLCVWFHYDMRTERTITTLQIDSRREIRIVSAPSEFFPCEAYQVWADGQIAVPSHFVGCESHWEGNKFALLRTSDDDLVAVIAERDPNRVLAMHEFSTGKSWPGSVPSESLDDRNSRSDDLLAKLRTRLGKPELRLN